MGVKERANSDDTFVTFIIAFSVHLKTDEEAISTGCMFILVLAHAHFIPEAGMEFREDQAVPHGRT